MLWISHIDGIPFRKLGNEYALTGVQAYNRVTEEISQLPDNLLVTQQLCDPSRFSGILIVDGKFVKVNEYTKKIPFIYAIDYLTHDIPHDMLALAEDNFWFDKFFRELKTVNYPLRIVVSDDRAGLKAACLRYFPYAKFQTCVNHYLENIRELLSIRTKDKYLHFFNSLKLHVFTEPTTRQQALQGLMKVRDEHAKFDSTLINVIMNIYQRQDQFFSYLDIPNCPNNTNLIELYNSHFNSRLKSLKGLTSFASAARFLNALIIRRRTKPFTDCEGKFKHLNKHAALELTIKKQALWPDILTKLGINKINYWSKDDENIH